jgi:transcriptional regulator with XRE-family HTH domain
MPRVHPVKTALAARGETQKQLAEAIGVAPGTVSLILNGRLEPWPAIRRKIADHVQAPEDQLFLDPVDRLLAERRQQGFGSEPSASAVASIRSVLGSAAS